MRVILIFTFLCAVASSCKKERLEPLEVTVKKMVKNVVVKQADSSQTMIVNFKYNTDGKVTEAEKFYSRPGKPDSSVTVSYDYTYNNIYSITIRVNTYLGAYHYTYENFTYNYNDMDHWYSFGDVKNYVNNYQRGYFLRNFNKYFSTSIDTSWNGNYFHTILDSIPVSHPDPYTVRLSFAPYYSSCLYPYVTLNKIPGELEYGSGSVCDGNNRVITIRYSSLKNNYSKEVWEAFAPGERIDRLLDILVFQGKNPTLPYSQTTPSGSEFYEYVIDSYGWIEKINVYQLNTSTGLKDLKTVYFLSY